MPVRRGQRYCTLACTRRVCNRRWLDAQRAKRPVRICACCNQPFEGPPNRDYCSKFCKLRAKRQRAFARNPERYREWGRQASKRHYWSNAGATQRRYRNTHREEVQARDRVAAQRRREADPEGTRVKKLLAYHANAEVERAKSKVRREQRQRRQAVQMTATLIDAAGADTTQ